MATDFGDYLRDRRLERGYTLRRFCDKHTLSPVDISRIENGITAAPGTDEELNQLAHHYEFEHGSPEMAEFLRLAEEIRNNPPKPLPPDHPEAVSAL